MSTVVLDTGDRDWARSVGERRHAAGGLSQPPNSGFDPIRQDVVGATAEVAVCRFYGEDPQLWVVAHDRRPGAIPDLVHARYKVGVKSTEWWHPPPTLYVASYDRNDIHVLVSVDLDEGRCFLWGWVSRKDLKRFPARSWQGSSTKPGAGRRGRMWHYVPSKDLRPCTQTQGSPSGDPCVLRAG